jgi:predicted exporter
MRRKVQVVSPALMTSSFIRILLILSAIVGLAVFSAKTIEFDTDPLNLLPEDMPEVSGLRLYQEHFGQDIDLILTIEGEDPFDVEDATRSLAESLTSAKNLVERADWQPPGMDDLSLYGELLAYAWLNAPPEDFKEFHTILTTPRESQKRFDAAVESLQSSIDSGEILRASQDPLGLSDLPNGQLPLRSNDNDRLSFCSEDGCFRLIFAAAPLDLYKDEETKEWLNSVRAQITNWKEAEPELASKVTLDYTGRAPYIEEVSTSMRSEMRQSVIITICVIAGLFWAFHRRILPLIFLLVSLALTFFITLSAGSLIFGKLGAGAVGFAAILIGLVVDYGFIIYEESKHHGIPNLRKKLVHSITWASITTAAVFAGLNLSGLPGASQLGSLVTIGIIAGLIVMMTIFVWLLSLTHPEKTIVPLATDPPKNVPIWLGGSILLFFTLFLIVRGVPAITPSADTVRPKHSHTIDVIKTIIAKLDTDENGRMRVIATGSNPAELRKNVASISASFAKAAHKDSAFVFPEILLPESPNQATNRDRLQASALDFAGLLQQADTAGLTEESLALTKNVLVSWQKFADSKAAYFYPSTDASRWILDKIIKTESQPLCALGYVDLPKENTDEVTAAIVQSITDGDGNPAGWDYLRPAILGLIHMEFFRVVLPMTGILLIMLWIAFKKMRSVALSMVTVAFSSIGLLAIMRMAGFEWNLINLAGVPLLLGAGLDYSIHMQLALKRCERGQARATGRALILCGISTSVGFGTLITSSNAGVESLGWVCSIGLLLNMLVAVFFLPTWWRRWS